jgi:hypothetical protein
MPPDQALLLPAPDSEAPDDLFPDEILGVGEAEKHTYGIGRELVELWDRVKSKVWQLDIQDSQIANWFQRNYQVEVRLDDLDLLTPPPRITAEQLDHFLQAIGRYSNQA